MKNLLILLTTIVGLGTTATLPAADLSGNKGAMPSHLMSMDGVRKKFGDPQRTLDPVGDPPIARWVYTDYTVYFEHHLVLTSVRHRAK